MRAGPSPWRALDVQVAVALVGVGGLVALTGWWGASESATVGDQVPWTAVAVAGLLLAQLGTGWLLLTGRVALRQRNGRLAGRLALAGAGPQPESGVVVAAASMTRYHRRGCMAVTGKEVEATPVEIQRRAGRRPCHLCRPEL